jgi:hypothetical protein
LWSRPSSVFAVSNASSTDQRWPSTATGARCGCLPGTRC